MLLLLVPQVSAAISELHAELRSCCDMMGIGLGGPRKEDTVAEVGLGFHSHWKPIPQVKIIGAQNK